MEHHTPTKRTVVNVDLKKSVEE
jgi:formamidase